MARADLLLNLVRAGARGDRAQFQKTVESLAAEERSKNHTVLAERLMAQLNAVGGGEGGGRPVALNGHSHQSSFVAESIPKRTIGELILPPGVHAMVERLVEEQHRADLLRSYNLEPRHRVLLVGPPGNGKTSLAEAIADRLGVSLLVVRYDAVIGSYLGETALRIGKVFDYARTRHCVLFFDEFDALGKERGDRHETGEIKRVVSSLLMQIDALPSHVLVVTATNHPELLDRAVWRRFQLRIELPMPKQAQIQEWLEQFETRMKWAFGMPNRTLAQSLRGACFGEIEEFGLAVLRRAVLSQPEGGDIERITHECLAEWKARVAPKRQQAATA